MLELTNSKNNRSSTVSESFEDDYIDATASRSYCRRAGSRSFSPDIRGGCGWDYSLRICRAEVIDCGAYVCGTSMPEIERK